MEQVLHYVMHLLDGGSVHLDRETLWRTLAAAFRYGDSERDGEGQRAGLY
jgi:hypothetical protein